MKVKNTDYIPDKGGKYEKHVPNTCKNDGTILGVDKAGFEKQNDWFFVTLLLSLPILEHEGTASRCFIV